MNHHVRHPGFVTFAGCATVVAMIGVMGASRPGPALDPFPDGTGSVRTTTTNSTFDVDNPFFQVLGTNGRSCVTCHQPSDGWSITPAHVRERFDVDGGFDPVFRSIDGATCPSADVSTIDARRHAYSLLLSKGLIRIEIAPPDVRQFSLVSVDDPYGCITNARFSMYRRPLPATNLRFLSTVMWDGRESSPGATLAQNLTSQARDATLGHAQAAASPTDEELAEIVGFESGLFTAQASDNAAGRLSLAGAAGGPAGLAKQPFFIGINDPIGLNPSGAPFDSHAFTLFDAWTKFDRSAAGVAAARAAIARGQTLFNTFPIMISGVGGLNDKLGVDPLPGTCTTCHDTPNTGNHSVSMPLNIGVSDASRRTPDLPLYTLHCDATGADITTTDPGRAMLTGNCDDIGKVKGPILRGLAARPPYFHNGSAATLADVVDFYDTRFNLHLTPQQKADLVAFLGAL